LTGAGAGARRSLCSAFARTHGSNRRALARARRTSIRVFAGGRLPIVKLADLLDQRETSAFLRGVIASRRYANAYLFHGPAGVGKGTAALAFARALLCEHGVRREVAAVDHVPSLFDAAPAPAPEPAAAPEDDACDACEACRKTASLQHPDLKFLFPVSGEEKELDTTIGETLAALRADPLFVFQYDKAASIRLSLTRELLRDLAFRPFEAERRVVVVRDADRMREDQYSALLKTLEEPGETTVWVLTTSRPSRLPATIRSRCQRVRFTALHESTIARMLTTVAGVRERDAQLLAPLANGSLARALSLRDLEPRKLRDEALALLEPARRGDAAGLLKAAQGFTKFGKAGRESLRRVIEFHQLWLRDLLRASVGAPDEMLVHRDRAIEIRGEAAALSATEIRRRLMVLEEILRAIEGNVSADLALFSGAARISGRRLGEGAWPAHASGRWDY
jgi:DNA polymerase III subunit delta'